MENKEVAELRELLDDTEEPLKNRVRDLEQKLNSFEYSPTWKLKIENQIAELRILAKAKAVIVPEGKGIFWTNKIEALEKKFYKNTQGIIDIGDKIEGLKRRFEHQCENCQILMQDRVNEIAKLKENQNHWATLENVTVCRLGIESLEEVLREFGVAIISALEELGLDYDPYIDPFFYGVEKLDGKDGSAEVNYIEDLEFMFKHIFKDYTEDDVEWRAINDLLNRWKDGEKTGLVIPSFEDENPTNNSLRESDSKPSKRCPKCGMPYGVFAITGKCPSCNEPISQAQRELTKAEQTIYDEVVARTDAQREDCPICDGTGINVHVERDDIGKEYDVEYPCQCKKEALQPDLEYTEPIYFCGVTKEYFERENPDYKIVAREDLQELKDHREKPLYLLIAKLDYFLKKYLSDSKEEHDA